MNYGKAIMVDDVRQLKLESPGAAAAAIYDQPIALRQIYEDPESGEEHYVVRYPAGVRCRVHRHSAAHTIVVVEGQLEANGQVIGPGSYAHFPAGEPMRHQATTQGLRASVPRSFRRRAALEAGDWIQTSHTLSGGGFVNQGG